jgi:hypothetical protein
VEFADRATPLSGGDPVADEPQPAVEYSEREQPCVAAPPEPEAAPADAVAVMAATGEFATPEPASFGLALAGAAAFLVSRRLRR